MRLREDRLKSLFEDRAIQRLRSERGCGGEDQLRRILDSEATAEERRAFADHLVACPDCSEEYRAAKSLAPWSEEAAETLGGGGSRPGHARAPRARSRAWMAVAAALAAALALVLVTGRHPTAGVAKTAERGTPELTRAVEPLDGARRPSPPGRLEWTPMEGATSYEVTIYDAESTPVWKGGPVTGTRLDMPPSALALFSPGRAYLWRVVGRVGIETRASHVFEFSIAP